MDVRKGYNVPVPDSSHDDLENEILFGRLAVKAGFCTKEDLVEALELLKQVRGLGKDITLGEVLIKKQVLTPDQVDDILTRQGLENENLIDGYRILKKLGEGGMGKVYKAIQTSMDRPVALKVLNQRYSDDKIFVQRFFREARAAGRLNHPNVVQGFDSGSCHGRHYFAMEYVEGETVDERIKREGPLEEREALRIALGVARALEHAQTIELVHRDIKPDNILIGAGGVVKLTDLGLAKETLDAGITRAGMAMGTPNYISPEQAKAESDVDGRADIYSLGASLFHMLTGEVPFSGPSIEVILTKHVVEPPRSVRSLRPSLSESMDLLVMRMMAKSPADRFQSPSELVRAIETITSGPGTGELPAAQRAELERLAASARPAAPRRVSDPETELPGGEHIKRAKFQAIQKDYEASTIVFYEGQEPDHVYLLMRGRVEIMRAGRVKFVIDGEGTYFGEISMLKGTPREYTARTVSASRIVELTREQYLKILQASPKLCLTVIERMAKRLKESDTHILQRDQKLEATRTQLKTQLSREGEVVSMLREIVVDWRQAGKNATRLKEFHGDVGRWIEDYDILDWAKLR